MTTASLSSGAADADVEPGSSPDDESADRWVTVREAASLAGVGQSTIRRWYRTGRVPTQRSGGDRGPFLVPLSGVMALAQQADDQGDALGDEVVDLNASYWSTETSTARGEAEAATNDAAEARRAQVAAEAQVDFLRQQLAEVTTSERTAVARLESAEAELAGLRSEVASLGTSLTSLKTITAATSSITDDSWLDLPTNSYRSPVRRQGVPVVDDVDEAPAAVVADEPEPGAWDQAIGEHEGDVLPEREKKGRRRRR